MLILSLDTSGDMCSVAVFDDATCLVKEVFSHERQLSERLPGIVQTALKDAGTTLADIDAFAVGLGPGSFTGVRIGVTMAKVWAKTLGKPVVGISSLNAIAEPYTAAERPLIAVAPTRRTESVAAYYYAAQQAPVAPPAVVAHTVLVETGRRELGLGADANLLLLGENAEIVYAATPSNQVPHLISSYAFASATAVARLAYARLQAGDTDDADTLVPLYVTPPPTG